MDGSRPLVVGSSLLISLVAVALSLLVLWASPPTTVPLSAPAKIDLSMLITGRGAIGGLAESHLFDPQMLVARQGDEVTLRIMNQSHFRHGIEIVGYGVRTGELNGGASRELSFTADKPGIFEYRCYIPYDPATATCGPDHDQMIGHLVVVEGGKR